MTWAVCTSYSRRQNARLPDPIRLRSLLITIQYEIFGLKQRARERENKTLFYFSDFLSGKVPYDVGG